MCSIVLSYFSTERTIWTYTTLYMCICVCVSFSPHLYYAQLFLSSSRNPEVQSTIESVFKSNRFRLSEVKSETSKNSLETLSLASQQKKSLSFEKSFASTSFAVGLRVLLLWWCVLYCTWSYRSVITSTRGFFMSVIHSWRSKDDDSLSLCLSSTQGWSFPLFLRIMRLYTLSQYVPVLLKLHRFFLTKSPTCFPSKCPYCKNPPFLSS